MKMFILFYSFGFKTVERSYLLRINDRVAERPQHMIMRVAVGIHGADIDRSLGTCNLMSERYFTHASPTLFTAGTPHPQLSQYPIRYQSYVQNSMGDQPLLPLSAKVKV